MVMETSLWIKTLPGKQTSRYTYENTVYTGIDNKIEVTCAVHGSFWQNAYIHKKGAECPQCYSLKRGASQKGDKNIFIAKTHNVKAIAGKYNYSLVDYVNSLTPVTVICHDHGEFKVTPGNHLAGKGCPECFNERRHLNHRNTRETFIGLSVEEHGEKYDYEGVVYVDCKTKVDIGCKEHGAFSMTPDNHVQGQGCPKCAKSGYNKSKPGYLYVLSDGTITKVGITNRLPTTRVKEILKSGGPSFSVHSHIYSQDGSLPRQVELATHAWLTERHVKVQSVFDGSTECFLDVNLEELLTFITPLAAQTEANNRPNKLI